MTVTTKEMPISAKMGTQNNNHFGNFTRYTAPLPSEPIKFSRGKNTFDNCPEQKQAASWEDLWNIICEDRGTAKGQQFVCAPMAKGLNRSQPEKYKGEDHWRQAHLAECVGFLALDCDYIPKDIFDPLLDLLADYAGCSYTTSSHTPNKPRARAFVALSRPVNRHERVQLGKAFERFMVSQGITDVEFDDSVYKPEQPCFLPTVGADFYDHGGKVALDVDALLGSRFALLVDGQMPNSNTGLQRVSQLPDQKTEYAKLSPIQLETVLGLIPADDEQMWSDVCNGTARAQGEDGRLYFHKFSKRSEKYDAQECDQRYSRALRELSSRPDGYGAKYLIAQASKHPDWPSFAHLFIGLGYDPNYDGQLFPVENSISAYAHGDIKNGQIFAQTYRNQLLYVTGINKWLAWGGSGWSWCNLGEEVSGAKAVAMDLVKEAAAAMSEDKERGKSLMQHAMASQSAAKLEAMVKLAKSEPDMSVEMNRLDADPMYLGVKNGVVDLESGALLAHTASHLITKSCNASYIREAQCPQFIRFLNDIFENDQETIECVQRLLGYTLTGLNTEEVIIFCVGYGSNGKSVFGNIIHTLMGDYSTTRGGSILVARKAGDNSARPEIAGLAGCRYLGINETQAGDKLDEQGVKMLAGREPITARFLYGSDFTFMPQFTPWLRTNHKPRIHGTDDGIWRRIMVLPFNRRFTDDEKDPHLERKLMTEADGILSWIVEGCHKYLHDGGLKPSKRMKAEVMSYREDSDLLGEFLSDETFSAPSERVEEQKLYHSYTMWCGRNGCHPLSKHRLTTSLKERGYPQRKSSGGRYYNGLCFKQGELPGLG